MFSVFAGSGHPIANYMSSNDVDVKNWTASLNVKNMKQYNDRTVFRRFLTGPPGVPDTIQQKKIEAFKNVITNEKFREEARKAARPIFNPAAKPPTHLLGHPEHSGHAQQRALQEHHYQRPERLSQAHARSLSIFALPRTRYHRITTGER